MFIRNERSIKEFIRYYPVVSTIIIIHILTWLLDIIPIGLFNQLYHLGVGSHWGLQNGEYWRFITPIFLHGGLTHMLFNSFSLVLFGPALEEMLGKAKFLFAYIGAGVLANIATFIIHPSILYSHVGASGAIFGLFGVYVFMVAFRKNLIDSQSSQIVMVIFIIGIIMTFLRPNINIYAHILGFVVGFLIAPLVLNGARPYYPPQYRKSYDDDGEIRFDPNRWKKKRFSRKTKQNFLWTIIIILVVIGVLYNVF
ncbi:rhomboid family intramembrane serine protease [Ornithinibacillus sp. BX22]|uniref:Rhomboid family intramembrane serine protease n=1 Tax=Ornithinibacillus hominis TaxID=2763055 RepID=A0A923RI52_9BACI|nr:rhomboid family intramembrane serine protease [Ornithinibacillus hominis]MBC5636980.1 rhomboid family intramembrane serine protease [Ornithinibacillus hominis]